MYQASARLGGEVQSEGGQVSWGDAPLVINPFDEYAVEGALQQKEATGGTVTALCHRTRIRQGGASSTRSPWARMMPSSSRTRCLNNIDSVGAARILAAAIQKIGGVEMVVFGRQTLDNGSGLTPAQTARVLGWPMLGLAGQIKVDAGSVQAERVIEEGRQIVKAKLPAVVSVVQSIGEPRYPSFMGIRKASKQKFPFGH
jgi:electron transfer flavoprotein beta subunit